VTVSALRNNAVAATVLGQTISLAEVDARLGDELVKINEQLFAMRREATDRLAVEMLVRQAAQRDNVSEDEWLRRKIEPKLKTPTEREIEQLFYKVRDRLESNATVDSARTQLVAVLYRESRGKQAKLVFDELKREAQFELVLEPPARVRKAVDAVGPSKGKADAAVTIVVFGDFQCPFCGRATETVDKVLAGYPDDVRLVYRQFPLGMHADAPRAAEASLCADAQGKFWAFHDALYANPSDLSQESLAERAHTLGLDLTAFGKCLDSGAMADSVKRDVRDGERLGVNGTPAYFINGLSLSGARGEEEFRQIIDAELKRLRAK
jgi:protein-disulfide isomerase